MKDEVGHEKRGEEEWFEAFLKGRAFEDVQGLIKPFVAGVFFAKFIEYRMSPNLLREWLQGTCNLTLEDFVAKFPETFSSTHYNFNDLLKILRLEIIAFGIRVYKLRETYGGYWTSTGDWGSLALQVDAITETALGEEYKRVRKKYTKAGPKDIHNLLRNSLEEILNSFFSYYLAPIKPRIPKPMDDEWVSYSKVGLFPFFIDRIVDGIFQWATSLNEVEAYRIKAKIQELNKKINSHYEEALPFLEAYGFGKRFYDDCWKKMWDCWKKKI